VSKRGARTAGEARLIRDAVARGWVRLDRTGTNHVRLLWPLTKATVTVPSKLDDGFVRAVQRRLERIEKGAGMHAKVTTSAP